MSQHHISRRRSADPVAVPGTAVVGSPRRTAAASARPLAGPADADLGATTVEYAVVVLAAAAFGGVMAAVISSDQVRQLLTAIIERALGI